MASNRIIQLGHVHLALWVLGLLVVAGSVRADDVFCESDDYEEGEGGAVDVFLQRPEYCLMVEDLERNDTGFDWAWVLTPAHHAAIAPEPARKGVRKYLPRTGGRRNLNPRTLGFDLRSASTVAVLPVQNFAGIFRQDSLEMVRGAMIEAVHALGLQSIDNAGRADLELGVAVVDQMRSEVNVPVYGVRVQPFLTLELRLVDKRSNQTLLLVRNRRHGGSGEEAALNFADDLVKFLR